MVRKAPRPRNAALWIGAATLAVAVGFGLGSPASKLAHLPTKPVANAPARYQAQPKPPLPAPMKAAIPAAGGVLTAPPQTVRMLDAHNGYGWSTGLAVTHDAGTTWTDVTPKDISASQMPIVKGYFVDSQTGWAFSLRPAAEMTVYGTRDGGQSWSKLTVVPVKYGDGNMSVTFADSLHGWFEVLTAGMGQHTAELFATSDGGKTWVKAADSASRNSAPFGGQITAQADGTLWLSGGQRAAAYVGGPGFIWLFKSIDAGKTWEQAKVPVPIANQQDTTSVSPPVFYGSSGLLGVLYSSGGAVIYGSDDSGKSWAVRGTPPTGNWPVFADALNGWQTDGQLLYRTSDGGRSWLRLASDSTLQQATSERYISQLDFVDAEHGWAVLEGKGSDLKPMLLSTSDGGTTWRQAM